jgi:phage-related protein
VIDVAVIGSAHIVVKAITTGFQRDVKKALQDMRPSLEKEGQQSAKSFSKGFKDQSEKSLSNFKPLRGTKENFEMAGQSSARAFATSFKRQSSDSLENFNPFRGKQAQFRDSGQQAGTAFGSGLKKQIRESLTDLDSTFDRGGKRAGKAFGKSFKQETADSLASFDPTRGTRSTYSAAGRRASAAFAADFKKDIRLALKDLEADFYKAGQKGGKRFQQGFRDETRSFKKYFSGLFDRDGGEGGIGRFLSGLTPRFGNFSQAAKEANDAFFRMVTTGYFVGPLVGQLVGSISALVSGLFALGSAVGAAIPSLIVLPGIFAAIGQAALTLKLAFSGIGEAVKQYTKTTGGAADNAKRIEQAERRLAQVLETNRERLVQADKNLERAERDLTEARVEAAESLQQLNFDAEDAALSEKRAAIQLEKAREALARVQDLPPNSRARREAELAYAEADLNLRRAKDRNADLAKETEEANQKGVEGSDQVVAATERVQDAIDAKARAERDALRAQTDAEEALQAAREGSAGAGGGNLDKLSEEAKNFAKFIAEVLIPEIDKLKQAAGEELFGPMETALRNLIDGGFFEVLQDILRDTGAALGVAAIDLSEFIASAENLTRLEKLGETNVYVIERLGIVFGNLYESMLIVLNAADPLIRRFTDWIVAVTEGWTETLRVKEETGELTETFNRAGDVAAQLGRIFGNLWGAIMNIGSAASGPGSGGQMLLDMFEDSTARFEEFTAEISENGKLQQYFVDVAENFGAISSALVGITAAFLKLADNPAIGEFWNSITESGVLDVLTEIFDILIEASVFLVPFGVEVAELIRNFTETGSIQTFFGVLTDALSVVNDFLSQPLVQKILLQTAAFLGAVKALTLLSKIGKFVGKVIAGYFIKFAEILVKLGKVFLFIGNLATGKAGLGTFAVGGAIVVGIAAVVAAFVGMWKYSEKFREAIKKLGKVLLGTLVESFERVKEALDKALEPLGGMSGAADGLKNTLKALGDFIGTYIVPIIQRVLVFAIQQITDKIVLFIGIVSGIIQAFQGVWEFVQGIFALFRGDWQAVSDHFGAALEKMWGAIQTIFSAILNFIIDTIQAILDAILPWDVDIRAIFQAIGDFISEVWGAIWTVLEPILDVVKEAFSIAIDLFIGYFNLLKTVYTAVFEAMWTVLEPIWEIIKTAFQVGIDLITTLFTNLGISIGVVWDGIKAAFNIVWDAIKLAIDTGIAVATALFEGFGIAVGAVWDGIKTAFTTVWDFISSTVGTIGDIFSTAFGAVADVVESIINGIGSAFGAVAGFVGSVVNSIWGAFKTVFNGIAGIWNSTVGKLSFTIPSWVPKLGGKGFSMPQIPTFSDEQAVSTTPLVFATSIPIPISPSAYAAAGGVVLADGGIVPATRGGMIAVIGEAGRPERVEPLDDDGLSKRDRAMIQMLSGDTTTGVTINVYPSKGMDESEVASAVSRELAFQLRRGAMR